MLRRGTLVLIALDPAKGQEQKGLRPAVVVGDAVAVQSRRYPLLCVVPLTGTPGAGALYPPIAPGRSGLAKRSYALIDQLRSVDKRRVTKAFGRVSASEMSAIEEGVRLYLGL